MKIIYLTTNRITPITGGIERITYSIASAMTLQYGHSCYSIYRCEQDAMDCFNPFKACYHITNKEQLLVALNEIGEGMIVLQSPCSCDHLLWDIASELSQFRFCYVFHGVPGFEITRMDWNIIGYRLRQPGEKGWIVKQCILQLMTYIVGERGARQLLRKKYAMPYGRVHKIILPAQGNIKQYQEIAPYDNSIFRAIPNALSFPYEPHNIWNKKQEVLIVARLDDWHKHIKKALQIWENVQRIGTFLDWRLRIVGFGVDESYYKKYVTKNHIPNVTFEGLQDPIPYYQTSSIYMMTSVCEGWGLSLTEAQQYGCVPIAFNSFASACEIIVDGENGFVISNNDTKSYCQTLVRLMTDESLRAKMSQQAISMCERYTIENIAQQWNQQLEELC